MGMNPEVFMKILRWLFPVLKLFSMSLTLPAFS